MQTSLGRNDISRAAIVAAANRAGFGSHEEATLVNWIICFYKWRSVLCGPRALSDDLGTVMEGRLHVRLAVSMARGR